MFFGKREPFVDQSLEAHRRLRLRLEVLGPRASSQRRYPQVSWDGVEVGLFEPELGALMARRAVQTLVQEFVAAGGEYRLAAVPPPATARRSTACAPPPARRLRAERYVFACGPWLPKLFPSLLGDAHLPDPPGGLLLRARERRRALPARRGCPGWADFNDGDIYYGFPDLESRGFKIAHDQHGERFDPDSGDRRPSAAGIARRAGVPGPPVPGAGRRARSSRRASASTRTARTATC